VLILPKVMRASRWIDRAGGVVMATLVIMPSTLMVPRTPATMFAAAIREGDAAFQAFDNETARLCYERAFAIDSTNCSVLCKLARADVHHGMAAPNDEKAAWYASAEGLARRCVASCPDSSEAHFILAIAIGQMTKVVGGKRKIELSKDVKREAETALSIDPRHAGAMHVLGRWNYEVAGLGWFSRATAKIIYGGVPAGSYEQAKEWFERAIAVRPEMPLNHLWLGETLIKLHDYTDAREELQTCVNLGDVLWDDHLTKAQAEKRLHDIEGKN
jgi:tetratricopeptide (TPR) repeat protein